MKKTLLLLTLLISITTYSQDKNNWTYEEFAKVVDVHGNPLCVLEYGIPKLGYKGQIKWRVVNNTIKDLYDVSIGKKKYTLQNGKIKNNSDDGLFGKILSGSQKSFGADPVNISDNKGAWSDKNDNPVVKIEFPDYILKFKLGKDGDKIDWTEIGQLKMKK